MDYSFELNEKICRIVNRHSASIVRIAFTFVRNLSDAEDIAQEVFLVYFRKAPRFHDEGHEKAWLIKVAINKSKDFLKSSWKKRIVPLSDDLSYIPNDDLMLLETVFELDEKYRLPVYLYYFDDFSIKEIARMLNINPSTIGTRLDRGRNKLKEKLGDDFL